MWHWKHSFQGNQGVFLSLFCQGANWQSWGWACILRQKKKLFAFQMCFFFFFFLICLFESAIRVWCYKICFRPGIHQVEEFFSPDKKMTAKRKCPSVRSPRFDNLCWTAREEFAQRRVYSCQKVKTWTEFWLPEGSYLKSLFLHSRSWTQRRVIVCVNNGGWLIDNWCLTSLQDYTRRHQF